MDGITVITFLRTTAILAALLLIGMLLRAKISWMQKLYLPASVIGGTIAWSSVQNSWICFLYP